MRILLSIHHKLDRNAGAPGVTLRLAEAYRELGHTADILSMSDIPAPESLGMHTKFPWFTNGWLGKHAAQYDVLDLSSGDGWLFQRLHPSAPQLVVTRSHGLEHVGHIARVEASKRGGEHLSWKYPLYHGGWRLWEVAESTRMADLSLFLNTADLEYAVNELRVRPERAQVVDNGISEAFLGLPFKAAAQPALRIAVVGTYIDRKINVMPKAINRLFPLHPDWRLGFFGTGVEDEAIRKDFVPDIQNQIVIHRCFENTTLPTMMSDYDVLLFPSLSEGSPLSVYEAMACGLALAASALPTITERVRPDKEGVFFPPGDPDAIARVLEGLAQHPERLLRLREAAYAKAQEFSWSRIATDTLALYKQALQTKQRAH